MAATEPRGFYKDATSPGHLPEVERKKFIRPAYTAKVNFPVKAQHLERPMTSIEQRAQEEPHQAHQYMSSKELGPPDFENSPYKNSSIAYEESAGGFSKEKFFQTGAEGSKTEHLFYNGFEQIAFFAK